MGKSRRKTKNVGEMSRSCEFFSSVQRLQEQDHEALLRNAETLKGELERLQLLNERLNGEGVYGLSSPELLSLKSKLSQGLLSVNDQLAKEEHEMVAKQLKEDVGTEWIEKYTTENLTRQLLLSARRKNLRKKARELRGSSSEARRGEHDHEALLQNTESMKSEIERLRLLNERMCGKELDGLSYFELKILRREIMIGFNDVMGERVRIKYGQSSSLDNDTDYPQSETSEQFRFLGINA